ncbi:MAG: DUF5012 domain-containing protein [Prevotella sp.]|nr:DUF5012 domain-containing protein [Prevotella sp.]
MKKNIFFAMMLALVSFALTSCDGDKDSEGQSRFTYYPILELKGDGYMVVDKGTTFQDPGYTATLNGEDVSNQVNVNSNVNMGKSGVYTVVYSIKNSDGITANAKRTVVVLDPNSAVEGFYLNQADSYRLREGAQVAYGSPFETLIIDNGDGTYAVDDLLGGWYCQRVGYGTNYAMAGVISIEDGSVVCEDAHVPGWNDGPDDFEGSFDATTSTFHLNVLYAGMNFVQTWVKE